MKRTVQNFRIQFHCNKQSNQSLRFITSTRSTPFANRILIFSLFSAQASIYAVQHVHLPWKNPSPHLSPRFKLLPATRLVGKQKDTSNTATAASTTTTVTSNMGGWGGGDKTTTPTTPTPPEQPTRLLLAALAAKTTAPVAKAGGGSKRLLWLNRAWGVSRANAVSLIPWPSCSME
jgi:hypothetical protein